MTHTEFTAKITSFETTLAALKKEHEALKAKLASLATKAELTAAVTALEAKMAAADVIAARKLAALGVPNDKAPGAGKVSGSAAETGRERLATNVTRLLKTNGNA